MQNLSEWSPTCHARAARLRRRPVVRHAVAFGTHAAFNLNGIG